MAGYRYTFRKFLRDWMLVFGMVAGSGAYLAYHAMPALHAAGPVLEAVCTHLQPVLLFIMLFLSFCKIEPHQMRPHRWQGWLLLIQAGLFTGLALLLV
jgi:BASS family bile acid:Na+ symporter